VHGKRPRARAARRPLACPSVNLFGEFDFLEVQLDRCRAAENRDRDLDPVLLEIELLDSADKAGERSAHDLDAVADLVIDADLVAGLSGSFLARAEEALGLRFARGADFESGNVIQRIRNMLPILVPLFVSAIRRANELALAMDARCYHGGKGRTKMHPLQYKKRDLAAYGVCVCYVVLLTVVVKISPF